jgi:hypothetical protein
VEGAAGKTLVSLSNSGYPGLKQNRKTTEFRRWLAAELHYTESRVAERATGKKQPGFSPPITTAVFRRAILENPANRRGP